MIWSKILSAPLLLDDYGYDLTFNDLYQYMRYAGLEDDYS